MKSLLILVIITLFCSCSKYDRLTYSTATVEEIDKETYKGTIFCIYNTSYDINIADSCGKWNVGDTLIMIKK
jgi:hypothetical protein